MVAGAGPDACAGPVHREAVFQAPTPSARKRQEYFLPHYGISESGIDGLTRFRLWKVCALALGTFGLVASTWLWWYLARRQETRRNEARK